MIKRYLFVFVALLAMLVWGVCPTLAASRTVGISLPLETSERWARDGEQIRSQLEAAGYTVDLRFAKAGTGEQAEQLASMIAKGYAALLVTPNLEAGLGPALQGAVKARIPVIAYDRPIQGSEAVRYYVTFNGREVGRMQGTYVINALQLDTLLMPVLIELFAGSPNDPNARQFFMGAMDKLRPYIQNGMLLIKSGQTNFQACSVADWSAETARTRMAKLITTHGYGRGASRLAAVLAPNDSVAEGVSKALLQAGVEAKDFPLLTGQDCDRAAIIRLQKGTQAMSIFKDTRVLASMAVNMVDVAIGKIPLPFEADQYLFNGVVNVPTFFCSPVQVTRANFKEKLVSSGYYTEQDLR